MLSARRATTATLVLRPQRRPGSRPTLVLKAAGRKWTACVAKMYVPSDRWAARRACCGRVPGARRHPHIAAVLPSTTFTPATILSALLLLLHHPSFGGRSPEKTAARALVNLFTFVAVKVGQRRRRVHQCAGEKELTMSHCVARGGGGPG